MKKLKYLAFLMVVSMIGLTSCDGDDDDPKEPSIFLNSAEGYALSGDVVEPNEEFTFGIIAQRNEDSKEDLVRFTVEQIHNNVPQTIIDTMFDGKESFNPDVNMTLEAEGDYNFKFTIFDEDDESDETQASIVVKTENVVVPLSDPMNFEWVRAGGVIGTGLEMFGLKWDTNVKDVHAKIEKNGAEKLVILSANDWESITNQEELANKIENASGVDMYNNVSADASSTYNDVIATKYDGKYFIINVKEGEVQTSAMGTTIKIKGEYKSALVIE